MRRMRFRVLPLGGSGWLAEVVGPFIGVLGDRPPVDDLIAATGRRQPADRRAGHPPQGDGRWRRRPARHASENLAVLRHIALNLLRWETTAKIGIAMKLPMAGSNNACLFTVLGILM